MIKNTNVNTIVQFQIKLQQSINYTNNTMKQINTTQLLCFTTQLLCLQPLTLLNLQ